MFVQVIRGPVRSQRDVAEMFERWDDELRPSAVGWLGTTAGFTEAGELLALVRFASATEAARNSERPEQGSWWKELAERFSGPVTFHDCEDVAPVLEGGTDDAGFVQVLELRGRALPSAAEVADAASRSVRAHRPDVLGGLVAGAHDDGVMFMSVYFTSEREAREAESTPMPDDVQQEWDALLGRLEGDPTYHDLRDPMLAS